MADLAYRKGAAIPNARITCRDDAGTLADLSLGALSLERDRSTFTGPTVSNAGSGVAEIAWNVGDLATLDVGVYELDVVQTISGEKRLFSGRLEIF